jgi:hypothetical protein
MARLEVNGFEILRTIGVHAHLFKMISADVGKAARALVIKQIAHKNTALKSVRDIRAAVGPEAFSLIVDAMSDAQIKSLTLKLDRHAAQAKAADGTARRHIIALAEGSAQPFEQPTDAPKTIRPKKTPAPPSSPPRVHYVSAGATRKR